jgi:hypothetical protein
MIVWKTEWEGFTVFPNTHLVGAGDILYCIGNFMDLGAQVTAYRMKDARKVWDINLATPYL